jgi:hypothetical protein
MVMQEHEELLSLLVATIPETRGNRFAVPGTKNKGGYCNVMVLPSRKSPPGDVINENTTSLALFSCIRWLFVM